MSEEDIKQQITVNIPVDWHIPENISRPYASNVFVQAGQYEAIISFFQSHPPLLTGTREENQAKLKQIESIRAECVAQVIVNPELIPKIIEALQTSFQQYQNLKQTLEEEGQQ
jgi:hypothetical protein